MSPGTERAERKPRMGRECGPHPIDTLVNRHRRVGTRNRNITGGSVSGTEISHHWLEVGRASIGAFTPTGPYI
jgi:hypothetical protein